MPESQLMVLEVSFVDMDQPMRDLQAIQITASKQTHKSKHKKDSQHFLGFYVLHTQQ